MCICMAEEKDDTLMVFNSVTGEWKSISQHHAYLEQIKSAIGINNNNTNILADDTRNNRTKYINKKLLLLIK